ncbi:MAG: HAD-IIIC family phosphatase [Thermodesulfobacteriota bacterium]
MYQLEWGYRAPNLARDERGMGVSKVDIGALESVYLIHWLEHCLECAVPECYATCPLFLPRKDKRCARFQYGIFANPDFRGLFDHGADITFRRWGKLEANTEFGNVSVAKARFLSRCNHIYSVLTANIACFLAPLIPMDKLTWRFDKLRDKFLQYFSTPASETIFDEFIIEAWNPTPDPYKMLMEYIEDDLILFRSSILMAPGYNFHKIPCSTMGANLSKKGRIFIHPENDREVRIIFTWLDFVRYKPSAAIAAGSSKPRPAPKVKCVAWDLDNTLWKGILVEDGPEALQPLPNSLELIRKLDERGIIQTVVSKNDYEPAWAMITKLGLKDYFIYPAINWGAKSQNIIQVAREMDINVDTFALIDDSPFERGEVNHELPQVRTYGDTDILDILQRPEFDVPITAATQARRLSYLAESQRKRILQTFPGNYEQFLESCKLIVDLFAPVEEQDIVRCLELLQRTNQLNLSTKRYSEEDFRALLNDKEYICVAARCKDNFGDYGIIGFFSINMSTEYPMIFDFILSCRVARKKVENALVNWMMRMVEKRGFDRLEARYIRSQRNGLLLLGLQEVGFEDIKKFDDGLLLELKSSQSIPQATIVQVNADRVNPGN